MTSFFWPLELLLFFGYDLLHLHLLFDLMLIDLGGLFLGLFGRRFGLIEQLLQFEDFLLLFCEL